MGLLREMRESMLNDLIRREFVRMRKEKGVSQEKICELLSYSSKTTISRFENGGGKNLGLTLYDLYVLADFYDKSLTDILPKPEIILQNKIIKILNAEEREKVAIDANRTILRLLAEEKVEDEG